MFVDIWVLSLFSLLFGVCAWWNRTAGLRDGIEGTLNTLLDNNIIEMNGNEVVPYGQKVKLGLKDQ